MRNRLIVAAALVALSSPLALGQADMLPDIIVDEGYLHDHYVETVGSRSYLRLSNGTANVGAGPLYLRGGDVVGDRQQVWQRIYRDDDSFWERLAGEFIYHPGHGHIHFDDWAEYRLREVTAGGGVGDIVATGLKTSFCIIDLAVYDASLPGFPPGGFFRSCGSSTQGLSVGWIDIYSSGLAGQAIEITGLEDGEYWLESQVDPRDAVIESDEDNNIARILVHIGLPPGLTPDRYEENDSRGQVDARRTGGINSPNLGPVGPRTTIDELSIDAPNDDDWFRFYMPATGSSGDEVVITFSHGLGDLDMEVYRADGTRVGVSQGVTNREEISLSGQPRGYYYARIYGWAGATNPQYELTIDPSQNAQPTIEVTSPPAGDVRVPHGTENYVVEWDWDDPEGNDAWVTIFVNTAPSFDGNEILLPTSLHTPADFGSYIINSAELEPGTYWVYGRITDGGTATGDWSQGTVTFYEERCPADLTGTADPNDPGYGVPDGVVDVQDFFYYIDLFAAGDPRADLTGSSDPNDPFYGVPDGVVDINDFFYYLDLFAHGCH